MNIYMATVCTIMFSLELETYVIIYAYIYASS